jgi:tetratricopeptide (TPR) repeat protein
VDDAGELLASVDEPPRLPATAPEANLDRLSSAVVRTVAQVVDSGAVLGYLTGAEYHSPDPEAVRTNWKGLMTWARAAKVYREGLFDVAQEGFDEFFRMSLRASEMDSLYFSPLIYLMGWYWQYAREPARADSICSVIETRIGDRLPRAGRAQVEFRCASLRGQHGRALVAARQLAEGYPNAVSYVSDLALDMNRSNEAVEAYASYDPYLNEYSRLVSAGQFEGYALALHLLGKHRQELRVVRQGREDYPEDRALRNQEIAALIALGRTEEALDSMEAALSGLTPNQDPTPFLNPTALECEVHGCPEVSRELWDRLLGWLESRLPETRESAPNKRARAEHLLHLERNEDALELWREVVASAPDNVEDLGRLGVALALTGNRDEALEISRHLEAWEDPWVLGLNTYWRACIAANLGELEEAVGLLWQAEEEGRACNYRLPHRNTYYRSLRGFPAFEEYVKPRG